MTPAPGVEASVFSGTIDIPISLLRCMRYIIRQIAAIKSWMSTHIDSKIVCLNVTLHSAVCRASVISKATTKPMQMYVLGE